MSDSWIAVVDVGHGNCTFVQDQGLTAMVDAPAGLAAVRFLENNSISKLTHFIASHGDSDHIAGLTNLLMNGVFVENIWLNPEHRKDCENTTLNRLLAAIRFHSATFEHEPVINTACTNHQPGNIDLKQLSLSIVAPNPVVVAQGINTNNEIGGRSTNSLSIVVAVKKETKTLMLITGDIDDIGLSDIEDIKQVTPVSVLIAPHHGGAISRDSVRSSFVFTELVEKCQPNLILFSFGRNQYNNPKPEHLEFITRMSPDTSIRCTQLSKHCSKASSHSLSRENSLHYSHGRGTGSSCAGTLHFTIESSDLCLANERDHDEFIDSLPKEKTPLCRLPIV